MRVMGRGLKPPDQLAVVGIERHDGAGPQVVAGAPLAGVYRIRIAGAPIEKVELRIVGAGKPGHASTVSHRFGIRPGAGAGSAGFGRSVPAPLNAAGLGIARLEETG